MWRKFKAFLSKIFKKKSENQNQVPSSSASSEWQQEWTEFLVRKVSAKIMTFLKAEDIERLYPNFHVLDLDEKILVIVEFIKQLCFFECGFNPKSYSVDVGSNNDKDTWSVGLMQLSVCDQNSYGLKFGYDFNALQDPLKNLNLGVEIMCKIIEKRGKIFIERGESGLYWAVIHPGGRYDKTDAILSRVHSIMFSKDAA